MTARQVKLVDAEISRHIALARLSKEPAMKRGHMEVAQALAAILACAERKEAAARPRRGRTTPPITGWKSALCHLFRR